MPRGWSTTPARPPSKFVTALQCFRAPATTIDRDREEILRIAAQHGARNVRVFGSVARGDDLAGSDVDLLVEMESDRSLLDLFGLEQDLEDLLGRHVDVLTDDSIHPAIRPQVSAEARAL